MTSGFFCFSSSPYYSVFCAKNMLDDHQGKLNGPKYSISFLLFNNLSCNFHNYKISSTEKSLLIYIFVHV